MMTNHVVVTYRESHWCATHGDGAPLRVTEAAASGSSYDAYLVLLPQYTLEWTWLASAGTFCLVPPAARERPDRRLAVLDRYQAGLIGTSPSSERVRSDRCQGCGKVLHNHRLPVDNLSERGDNGDGARRGKVRSWWHAVPKNRVMSRLWNDIDVFSPARQVIHNPAVYNLSLIHI